MAAEIGGRSWQSSLQNAQGATNLRRICELRHAKITGSINFSDGSLPIRGCLGHKEALSGLVVGADAHDAAAFAEGLRLADLLAMVEVGP